MCCELPSKVVIYAFPKTHNLKVVGSNPTPATSLRSYELRLAS